MDINNYISESFKPKEPMITEEQRLELKSLLIEAGKAHHHAFLDTDGDDPEWPLWYAEFIHEKTMDILDLEITKSELTYLLVAADLEHREESTDTPWADFYTSFFSESLS